nr:MAG TPA: hypothetical protein [Microviridae sp.]
MRSGRKSLGQNDTTIRTMNRKINKISFHIMCF